MNVQQARLDVLSNNLANVRTTGFKSEEVLASPFSRLLLQYREESQEKQGVGYGSVGDLNLGAKVDEVVLDLRNGTVQETFEPTNLALEGDGFFTVETAEGNLYTRDGSFMVNQDGYLATSRGELVLGEGGPVLVIGGEFKVNPDGAIEDKGRVIDRLALVSFKGNPVKLENNFYTAPDGVQIAKADNVKVRQGFLEKSNVQVADEMIVMITVTRIYEANQKVLKAQDELLDRAVNQVGSFR